MHEVVGCMRKLGRVGARQVDWGEVIRFSCCALARRVDWGAWDRRGLERIIGA